MNEWNFSASSAIAIDVIQHLVAQNQHGAACDLDELADRVGAGRSVLCRRAERRDALVAGKLAGDVNPRRLAPFAGVPCVPDKYRDLGGRNVAESGARQELRHDRGSRLSCCRIAVVKRREGVRLAAAELGDEGHDRAEFSVSPARRRSDHRPCARAAHG